MNANKILIEEFQEALIEGILKRWYPLVVDKECGGYFTNVSHDWSLSPEQEKMIVTQARHIWTLSKASSFLGGSKEYESMARHGFIFLKNKMWDRIYGGFFQIRSRDGGMSDVYGYRAEKRTYGNAFGTFALAALYGLTHDAEVLNFAINVFRWIEEHAYDSRYKGYFQFLTQDALPFNHSSIYKTNALDGNEVGFKDQNSSIHLLEAYTELYRVWKNSSLQIQLKLLLELIRDKMVTERGYLQLFFHNDWTPVSYCDSTEEERKANYNLDHISFGHDYETAFLMLEASHALGLEDDVRTLKVAKKMLDHALEHGWDKEVGGFYDAGYYLNADNHCTIIKDTKNWWAQAEGLNALLLFSKIFPDETSYYEYFLRQWNYVKSYLIDTIEGDWYEGGIDKEPQYRTGPKSHLWKCTYHTGRALMNCITMMKGNPDSELNVLIEHWKKTAKLIPIKKTYRHSQKLHSRSLKG